MKPEKKLGKVVFEYDDGTSKYIDGEELEKWVKAVDGTAVLFHTHFGKTGFEDIKWKQK
jgi:hypothetical protein